VQGQAGGAVGVVVSRPAGDPGPPYGSHLIDAESALDLPPVSKSFSGNRVLKEVPIRLAPGEVRGLAGLNGSGKSTLVKLLAGYHKPDVPVKAIVAGREFDVGSHDGAHSAGIRFVHQDLALIDVLDTVDNVGIGAGYSRRGSRLIDWRRMKRQTKQILGELGYSFDVNVPVGQLTPSQRTGVAIARALRDWVDGAGAKVVVLDEPTATMPIAEVENLFRAIDKMRQQDVAVILVTHRLDEILTMANTVSVLRNGSLVTTEAVGSMTHGRLVELMLGRKLDSAALSSVGYSAGPALLTVRNLGTMLIDHVDLEVQSGEIVGVAGLTGSGREDLLPAITGMMLRTGDVQVLSKQIRPHRPAQAVTAGLGYVPAHRLRDGLFPDLDMTANFTIANLSSVSRRHIMNKSAEKAAMLSWIEELAVIPGDPGAPILALSGGNQQKVVVGRWARPGGGVSVLLLDEPTQGVDVSAREAIYEALQAFTGKGAVLISSSDTDELCRICARVVVIYQGRIVAELSGDALTPSAVDSYTLGANQGTA
jgi:ribose transport system ATP-binding protein